MESFDISVPIRPGMFVYPGNPPVEMERVQALAAGDSCNLSRLDLGVHTGTHVDAPVHFLEGGTGVDGIALAALLGPAVVVDATEVDSEIDAAFVEKASLPPGVERVLFKTRNSAAWSRLDFDPDYVALAPDAAQALVGRGVRLVGLDYLSIGRRPHSAETHRILLGAGLVILEGVDLSGVQPGSYELICLPLRLAGADGAPARAILRR